MAHPIRTSLLQIERAREAAEHLNQDRGQPSSLLTALLASSSLLGASAAQAQSTLPQGGRVVAGSAVLSSNGSTASTVVQTSNRAIIDWTSFSVGRGDTVQFIQPTAQSAILNRVTGNTTSAIAGQITDNGQVYLINPNGIVITSTGSVNVGGGFVASTLDISDGNFMAGNLNFAGGTHLGQTTNSGSIAIGNGGFAALLGGNVTNTGTITVPMGKIALNAGFAATLDFTGDGFLQVVMPGGGTTSASALASGAVTRVVMQRTSAVAAVRDAVHVPGNLVASTAQMDGNALVLGSDAGTVQVSGTLNAASSTGKGGSIAIGGTQIALASATVDASGATGGGEITIGGGAHGAAVAGLVTANTVSIDAASSIRANAITTGSGGQVAVWSNNGTAFDGEISAQAFGQYGNGGNAEVSGHGAYDFAGNVNLLSAGGKAGTLLLDPYNLTISSSASSNQSGYTATGNNAVVNVTSLQTSLATASVTVSTGSSGAQTGNITVNSPITWSAATTLTLNAAGGITVNSGDSITATGGGSLALNAAAGTISVTSATLSTASGAISLTSSAAGTSNGISLSGATISAGTGTAALSGTSTSGKGVYISNGTTLTTSGAVSISGSATTGTGVYFDTGAQIVDNSGNLTVGGTSTSSGIGLYFFSGSEAITNNGLGTVSFTGTSSSSDGVAINSGLTTNGAVSITGNGTSGYGTYLNGTTITDQSGNLTISGSASAANSVWINANTESLVNSGSGTLQLSGSGGQYGIRLNTNAQLSLTGAVTVAGSSTANYGGLSFKGGNTLTIASGSPTISGTSYSGPGIYFQGATTINNQTGSLVTMAGSSSNNAGFQIDTGATATTKGSLAFSGVSTNFYGLDLVGSNTVTVSTGNLALTGSSTNGSGVGMLGTATLAASGTGLTISGSSAYGLAAGVSIVSGAAITTTGSATFTDASSSAATSAIDLAGTLTSSSGTLTLAPASTNGILIEATGLLTSTGGGNLVASTLGAGTIVNNGTISQGSGGSGAITLTSVTGAITNAGSISGSGSAGAISLTASGSGTVQSGSGTITQSGSGAISLSSANGDVSVGSISYTGGSANSLTVSAGGSITQGGAITASNAALATSLSGAALNGSGAINTNGGLLTLSASGSGSLTGAISGTGALVATAGGTITLSGANTYSGTTTVSAGTLNLDPATSSSIGAINVTGGATGATLIASGGTTTVNGNLVVGVGGSDTNAQAQLTGGNLTVTGTFYLGNASGASGTVTQSAGTVTVNGTSDPTFSVGYASGATGFYTMSGGTLNVFSGTFNIGSYGTGTFNQTGGTVNTGSWTDAARQPGSVGTYNLSGGAFNQGNPYLKFLPEEEGNGTVNISGTAVLNATGGVWYAGSSLQSGSNGTINLNGGTLVTSQIYTAGGTSNFNFNGGLLQAGAANSSFFSGLTAATIESGGAFINDGGYAITIGQTLSGSGGLTKTGTGTLTLTASNSYTGTTTVSGGGTLSLQPTGMINTLATTSIAIDGSSTFQLAAPGGRFDFNGTTVTFDATGGGVFDLAGCSCFGGPNLQGSLTVNATGGAMDRISSSAGTSLNLNGVGSGSPSFLTLNAAAGASLLVSVPMWNSGGLVKGGSGTVTLSGANTYSGGTAVNAGTMILSGSWNLGSGTANVVVASGATLSGAGVITASTLAASGPGTVSLTGNNMVSTISTSGTLGSFTFNTDQSLALGSINAGNDAILITSTPGSAANITLNSGAVLTSSATGTAIELAGDGNFVNNAGSGALVTANGRWLIYSAAPATDTFGGLNSGNTAVWNTAYGAVMSQSGDRYVFAYHPTVTFTTVNDSKTYGSNNSAAVAADYVVSGIQTGVSGVFLGDTAAAAYSGTPVVTSTGSAATASVAGGPYAINVAAGTTVALDSYALAYTSSGQLTIGKAALTLTGATTSTTYNGTAQTNSGASLSGVQGSDSFAITGYASGTNAGTYTDALGVSATGATLLSNYTVNVAKEGQLTIGKAALTLTGATTSTTYNGSAQTNAYAITSGQLYGSDTISSVTGLASGTNAGSYTDVLSGATGSGLGNYTIAYVNGGLTIGKAALTLTGATTSTTYNGTAQTNSGASLSGVQGSDSFAITGYASGTNAGTYTDALGVSATGATLLSNYTIGIANEGRLTIDLPLFKAWPALFAPMSNFLQGIVNSPQNSQVDQDCSAVGPTIPGFRPRPSVNKNCGATVSRH